MLYGGLGLRTIAVLGDDTLPNMAIEIPLRNFRYANHVYPLFASPDHLRSVALLKGTVH